jgi:hypothetical protein
VNYSSIHTSFAYNLNIQHNINKQDVLDNPEKYLGPNYREVLNYWFYVDSLSYEQRKKVYYSRIAKLSLKGRLEAFKIAKELASEIIDCKFLDCFYYAIFNYCEFEIIAAKLYIKQGIPFTFLSLYFDL